MKHHHCPHHHLSLRESLQQIQEGMTLQGFAIRHVLPDEEEPGFSYTVGLHSPGSSRPEFFISGLHVATRVAWLLDLGFRVQGPPPLETRQRMARAQGVPISALVFPAGGQMFQPGVRYTDLAQKDFPLCFGVVETRHYAASFGQALAFHRTQDFPVWQVVWPDTRGKFPWEDGFDPHFADTQHLLFDPQPLLPLQQPPESHP